MNASTELGLRNDMVAAMGVRYRSLLRDAVTLALDRAAALGEIDDGSIPVYANLVVGFMLGASMVVRSGASNDEIRDHVDAGRTMIDSWRS
ncbi:MAG: hypothetical protein GTN89_04135 [Acidobacteria bacterium]|nr:hypothetical protein [Acidobacteriota bacterium]